MITRSTFVRLSHYIRRKIHWSRSQRNGMSLGTKIRQSFLLNRFIEFWKVWENIYLYCSYVKAYRFLPHWAKLKKIIVVSNLRILDTSWLNWRNGRKESALRDPGLCSRLLKAPCRVVTILNLNWFTKWWIEWN